MRQYKAAIRKVMKSLGLDTTLLKGINDRIIQSEIEEGYSPEQFVDMWWVNPNKNLKPLPTMFTHILENGGIYFFDELDTVKE